MKITLHPAATRILGSEGCDNLPVRDVETYLGPAMESQWLPTAAELELLKQGVPLTLTVLGRSHPPVMLEVSAPTIAL